MTYRDRRAARAERLRGWAGKRQTRASAALATGDKFRGDHAFNFQPGHIPERARLIARTDAAFASLQVADRMAGKADEIDRQADRAIYSDDIDAPARLAAKLAGLEAQRDAMKARNAAFRSSHRAELKALSGAYERDIAMPHQGFELTNLGGTISRTRKRLAELSGTPRPDARAARLERHRAADPHCTCNDCVAYHAGQMAAPEAAEPTTLTVGATATARAGLSVLAGMTSPSRAGKAPRPVWTVSGNLAGWRALLLRLGGNWYRGSVSFWDDPTDAIEAAIAAIERLEADATPRAPVCELCGELAGDGGALCPACAVSR